MRQVGQEGHEPILSACVLDLVAERDKVNSHPGSSKTKEGRCDDRADPVGLVCSPGEPEQADLKVSTRMLIWRMIDVQGNRKQQSSTWAT